MAFLNLSFTCIFLSWQKLRHTLHVLPNLVVFGICIQRCTYLFVILCLKVSCHFDHLQRTKLWASQRQGCVPSRPAHSWSVLGAFRNSPSPPTTWLWICGVSTGCPEFKDLVYWTKGLTLATACSSHHSLHSTRQPPRTPSRLTCFPHRLVSPVLVFAGHVCIFLFDTALSQKSKPQGKCLPWPGNLCAGPARSVPERDLVVLMFVHTLGSGLLSPHCWQSCSLSSTMKMSEKLKVETVISTTCDENVYDH